ncbi:MAG TPA: glucose-6-phosphate isomerase, partial [Nitratifractor salsuginis]|nr:glucose-6-phosphate isomerase [Nitratifractor salsuginis]
MIEFRMPWRNESEEGYRRIAMVRDRLQWEKEQGISGYYHLPETEEGLIGRVESLARDGLPREVETLAVIGIGGSSLGAKAIDRALRVGRPDIKELLFLENTDPLDIAEKFARIDRERTLFLLISKS